ncbi:MAG: bifunctional phosphopantothenoylcysteine decarboxylase/phosphopantothenate--cysteine ligase CoaBC [Cardiobacteriaceae bacterium]|nr:bifunctional phosphopantothenoylcysteine decarboxylase/phosphopantothenate--cysteine ligase CoaBC [Cardiobacteriaceae bacterium]
MAQNILIGICGGIAAYKIPFLIRLLKKRGDDVRVVMTSHAQSFVTPTTLQALTGEMVRSDLFDTSAEQGMGHIELARWADKFIIAPASANTLGKLAQGIADNLLTTLYLATNAHIYLAPAMNCHMLAHPAVQNNLAILSARAKHTIIPSEYGEQACGDYGAGRLPEAETLLHWLNLETTTQDWHGIRLTLTAGPTREAIDPVRYISNHSSGKMGYALATAAAQRGADVTLVSGPTALPCPTGVRRLEVDTAEEMLTASLAHPGDIFIAAAAVADYRVATPFTQKMKKQGDKNLQLQLVQNPDIVATIAALSDNRPFVVGFAAETEKLTAHAKDKLTRKKLDLIVANDVSEGVFGADDNTVTLISTNTEIELPRQNKTSLADNLLTHILSAYTQWNPSYAST